MCDQDNITSVEAFDDACPIRISLDFDCYKFNNSTITANILEGTGPYTYLWSTGLTGASINIYWSQEPLRYSVTVTDTNGCETSASGLFKGKLILSHPIPPTSNLVNGSISNNLNIYLNPAAPGKTITIDWSKIKQIQPSQLSVKIFNTQGTLVYSQKVDGEKLKLLANLSEYSSGVYYIKVSSTSDVKFYEQLIVIQ